MRSLYSYIASCGRMLQGALLLVLVICPATSSLAQSLPNIGFCNSCSSSTAFANAAEEAAPNTAPGDGTPFIHPVYVINPANGSIQYFDVHVWYDWGDGRPHSADPDESTGPTRNGTGVQSIGLQKQAYPGVGDPTIFAEMQQAHAAAVEFANALEGVTVTSGEIGYDGDSAIGLIGPQDSPAGYNRLELQNRLTQYYSGLRGLIFAGFTEFATRLGNRLLGTGSGYISPHSRVHVEFPDGTRVQLAITNVSSGLNPGDLTVEFEVLSETAILPDGSTVPQSAGHFQDFSYSGDTQLIQFLSDLASLFGISVSGDGGSSLICVRVHGGPTTCERIYH